MGNGPGPDREMVRIVGIERPHGIDVLMVRSYEPGRGHARAAYAALASAFGRVNARDVVETGIAFHAKMVQEGAIKSASCAQDAPAEWHRRLRRESRRSIQNADKRRSKETSAGGCEDPTEAPRTTPNGTRDATR